MAENSVPPSPESATLSDVLHAIVDTMWSITKTLKTMEDGFQYLNNRITEQEKAIESLTRRVETLEAKVGDG
jgi:hypothetical protein